MKSGIRVDIVDLVVKLIGKSVTILYLSQPSTAQVNVAIMNGEAHPESDDWPGRYHHVDQILDRPGPRTDPQFMAGDTVRFPWCTLRAHHTDTHH